MDGQLSPISKANDHNNDADDDAGEDGEAVDDDRQVDDDDRCL